MPQKRNHLGLTTAAIFSSTPRTWGRTVLRETLPTEAISSTVSPAARLRHAGLGRSQVEQRLDQFHRQRLR